MASSSPYPALMPSSSPLRPNCKAQDRLFEWRGVNSPPPSTINDPWIRSLEAKASMASISDRASYGSGLKKFHTFCDTFSIPEGDRLPTSFEVLHSFVLWATADENVSPSLPSSSPPTGSVAESTARHYLAAIRAWHIAQGWDPPLKDFQRERINFSLRGLAKLQAGNHKKSPCPPVTTTLLHLVKKSLDLDSPFDACVWAIATCAFWGMMRLGEATVKSRSEFSPMKHLAREDAFEAYDLKKRRYMRLELPSAKTAKPGERQSVWLVPQKNLCPIEALYNLKNVVPAGRDHPLFSWSDGGGSIRPMAKPKFMKRFNDILEENKIPRVYGHSFRIGGASHYLACGVNPEIVRLDGRWRSLSYETYIRGFELAISHHLGDLPGG